MKETSGSLTATTVAVTADPERNGLLVANNSDTAMTYRPGGTATAAIGIAIPANTSLTLSGETGKAFTKAAGTLFCAGTGKTYTIYEW
jgi:hypothetical protein